MTFETPDQKKDRIQREQIVKCFTDFEWRLKNLYHIVNESGETILFKPNFIQSRILKERSDYRDVILKYRQGGVSTLFIILMLDEVLFGGTNVNNIFITHRQELLDTFFKTARFIFDSIPAKYKVLLPKPSTDNANELAFDKTANGKILNNRLKIALDVRGKTPTRLHISEFAHMDHTKQVALKLSIDNFRQTKITIESTANGLGDVFYHMAINARDKIGTYHLLFYPWYIEDRNNLPTDEDLILDDYEIQIRDTYNLTTAQLNWRRQKIYDANALGKDGVALFNQENPITIESAFITSGIGVFDLNVGFKIVHPIKEIDGIKYFQKPCDKIVAGIDIAEGGIKGDFSAIVGYNIHGQVIFTFKGKLNEELFAKKIDSIFNQGYIFNLLPENNVGIALINECKKYWWFIYMLQERKTDKLEGEDTQVTRYGFKTTQKSKDLIIREYKGALFKKNIEITEEIYSDIITYVYDKNNRPNAIYPNHDDQLMAGMISRHGVIVENNLAEKDEEEKKILGYNAEDRRDRDINKNNDNLQNSENLLLGEREDYF